MGCSSSKHEVLVEGECSSASFAQRFSKQRVKIPLTEHRGIKLPQLKELMSFARHDCDSRKWKDHSGRMLTADDANLYIIVEYVVKPMTTTAQCSYVELIASGPQLPNWFVSHWWGQPVAESVKCLSQHAQDRDLGEDVNYWICAYAANQWTEDQVDMYAKNDWYDPANSPFLKAMRLAEGTISVIDSDATCFTRTWCCAEIWSALQMMGTESSGKRESYKPSYKYDMYTMNGENAVGITDGFAHVDMKRAPHWWSTNKYQREKFFPVTLGRRALYVELEKSSTSEGSDRRRILNSIVGAQDLEAAPPSQHERYNELNEMLRGRFAASAWRRALECDEHLRDYSRVLAVSRIRKLALSFDSCDKLDDDALFTLAGGLPPTLREVQFDFNACTQFSSNAFQKLSSLLPRSLQRLHLELSGCRGLGDAGVSELAKALQEMKTEKAMEDLLLNFAGDGNISEQSLIALVQAIPSTVKSLVLNFYGVISLGDDVLAAVAQSLPSELLKFELRVARCPEVTDAGIESVTSKLPATLQNFVLDMRFCVRITDATAVAISKCLPPSLSRLETDFVSCSGVTENTEATLRQAVSSFKKLEFIFWGKDDFNINQ